MTKSGLKAVWGTPSEAFASCEADDDLLVAGGCELVPAFTQARLLAALPVNATSPNSAAAYKCVATGGDGQKATLQAHAVCWPAP